ncbi:MAG: dihydroxy-acid dehydratase, partial [Thermoanaerobaculia bacterium]
GHVSPEAAAGGPIAFLRDGDRVTLDVTARRLDFELGDEELAARRRSYRAPAPRATTGVLAKYARLVSSASEGAVTSPVAPSAAASEATAPDRAGVSA